MSLDDLRKAYRKEKGDRGPGALKPLPEDFYTEMRKYIKDLRKERAEIKDPYSNHARTLDREISNAIDSLEGLYKLRIGKIMELASIKASSMKPMKEYLEAMTPGEREVYDDLAEVLQGAREEIIDPVFSLEIDVESERRPETQQESPSRETPSEPAVSPTEAENDMRKNDIGEDLSVVHVLQDVPTFIGADGKKYKLSRGDIVTLPEVQAKGLCGREAAYKINIEGD